MERSQLLYAVGGVVLLVGVVAGGAYHLGLFPGGGEAPPPLEEGENSTGQYFTFVIENSSKCGTTCRDMTTNVTNIQNVSTNVSYEMTISVDEDPFWNTTETVGVLGPNESATTDHRVEVGTGTGLAIRGNDGYVTIETTVYGDNNTETLTERSKVG